MITQTMYMITQTLMNPDYTDYVTDNPDNNGY